MHMKGPQKFEIYEKLRADRDSIQAKLNKGVKIAQLCREYDNIGRKTFLAALASLGIVVPPRKKPEPKALSEEVMSDWMRQQVAALTTVVQRLVIKVGMPAPELLKFVITKPPAQTFLPLGTPPPPPPQFTAGDGR